VKLAHLVRRFFGALRPGGPPLADERWAAQVLGPRPFQLWSRMPGHDRRHSIGVARRVEAALASTEVADVRPFLAAALLHDVGKLDSGLGILGRVAATVCAAVAGADMAPLWSQRRGFTRRVGLYLRHPELGASRIELAGGPPQAVAWARAHHEPETYGSLGFPPGVAAALAAADDD
jgi:hypothetical protein